jgi:hypothetical protein
MGKKREDELGQYLCVLFLSRIGRPFIFHCPIIVEFWNNILHSHPQMMSFTIYSLFDFWNFVYCYLIFNIMIL